MPLPHESLSDIHILGKQTRFQVVRADDHETQGWLAQAPVCSLLSQHHILHVGLMHAKPPFKIVRTDQSGTFFLACFRGAGSILVDGAWKAVKAGQACLLPPHSVNALRVGSNKAWQFAWVRYFEPRGLGTPVATANSPVMGAYAADPVKLAIEGFVADHGIEEGEAAIRNHWVELIHHYVLQFSRPLLADDRIWRAWELVRQDLARGWTLDEIARLACLSSEQLRRLCLKHIGRSPIKHLTFLRMRHAAELLSTTDEKIETIAHLVGYENPFAFSNTFLKWTGIRPSEHR